MEIVEDYAQFFTATVYEWKPFLQNDKYKDIIIDSLSFLSKEKRIYVYAFVIMSNHIHLIWQMRDGHSLKNVQHDFLKYTAQQMKFDLADNNPNLLAKYEVNLKDRRYQFWQRNPLRIPLASRDVFFTLVGLVTNKQTISIKSNYYDFKIGKVILSLLLIIEGRMSVGDNTNRGYGYFTPLIHFNHCYLMTTST